MFNIKTHKHSRTSEISSYRIKNLQFALLSPAQSLLVIAITQTLGPLRKEGNLVRKRQPALAGRNPEQRRTSSGSNRHR